MVNQLLFVGFIGSFNHSSNSEYKSHLRKTIIEQLPISYPVLKSLLLEPIANGNIISNLLKGKFFSSNSLSWTKYFP
jgi:hypothetical protein